MTDEIKELTDEEMAEEMACMTRWLEVNPGSPHGLMRRRWNKTVEARDEQIAVFALLIERLRGEAAALNAQIDGLHGCLARLREQRPGPLSLED